MELEIRDLTLSRPHLGSVLISSDHSPPFFKNTPQYRHLKIFLYISFMIKRAQSKLSRKNTLLEKLLTSISGRVPPGSECSWHITPKNKKQMVKIDFSFFKMAKNCRFHYVALYSSSDCQQENLTKENEVSKSNFSFYIFSNFKIYFTNKNFHTS